VLGCECQTVVLTVALYVLPGNKRPSEEAVTGGDE
jgi:hypothetical protein